MENLSRATEIGVTVTYVSEDGEAIAVEIETPVDIVYSPELSGEERLINTILHGTEEAIIGQPKH